MVLVTGASGFIGRHLIRLLSSKGQAVRALYHANAPEPDLKNLPHISWQRCDLLDIYDVAEAFSGITEVYHCAAIVSFSATDAAHMMHFNVESTANVVNQSLEQGIRKMVYLSSVASLGRSEQSKEITEEEQWEESSYNSVYALSKHAAELEVWRGMGEGLNAVIINPGIVIGEGNWDIGTGRLMKLVNREFPFYTQGVTAWVDVRDVANVMYRLMQSDIQAERFILSAGNYAYKDIFTWMANALHKKPPHIRATGFMTALIWRWGIVKRVLWGKTSTVTKETAATAQRRSIYNNTKLAAYLPDFTYTPISQTIERMALAFQKQ